MHDRYYKGDKVKATDFTQVIQTSQEKIIRVTGSGAMGDEVQKTDEDSPLTSKPRPSRTPPIWNKYCQPAGKLMAVQAARLEALRRLGERIKGLQITSTTSVQDFVAQSDQIDTRMEAFIKGAVQKGEPAYHEDELIVDVTMQVTLREVYEQLKAFHDRSYKGDKVKASDFEERIQTVKDTVIEETGNGVPPAQYVKEEPKAETTLKRPGDWPAKITAKGQAAVDTKSDNADQAKLMAKKAAELDARRKLAEQIDGLKITSQTTVKDFASMSDDIATDMASFQQGEHVIDSRINDDGTAEATVELDSDVLKEIVTDWQTQSDIKIK